MMRFCTGILLALALALPASTRAEAGPPVAIGTGAGEIPTLAPILKKVTPSVVNIRIKGHVAQPQNSPLNDPALRQFFGLPEQPAEQEIQAAGSGVVIDGRAGLIVTNNHVVEHAEEITITFADGRQLTGQRLGGDPETDIALVKVEASDLTAIPFGDSDQLEVGDFVIAIGNPFQIGQTATSGIISGLQRGGLGIERYEDFIQTDASINPGNSGGALVSLRGELIGINTAIVGPSGGNVGIGFAIPVNLARGIVNQLLKYGDVRHGQLGFAMRDLTPDMVSKLALPETVAGAVITKVDPGSAAEHAGLKVGDVITALDRAAVRGATDLSARIGLLRAGDEVELGVLRGKQALTVRARLAERKRQVTEN